MVRVDIESIVMTSGPMPMPSVVVLRERKGDGAKDAPARALSIQTGAYEAAAIGHGIDFSRQSDRPLAHDLVLRLVKELGAKVGRIEINRWESPVFYADVVFDRGGEDAEFRIDARPSDALALAVRANAPIYVEDDVMNRAGKAMGKSDSKDEIERFDEFVQTLSPDDF